MSAPKVDLKDDDGYRAHRGEFRTLTIPIRSYLAIDGSGDPNTEVFGTAVEELYPVADAVERTRRKAPARLDDVRLQTLTEGRCLQTLHVGPFDPEAPVLHRLHAEVLPGAGLTPTGQHHEIYLSDPRRTDPARQRTILRQPVR